MKQIKRRNILAAAEKLFERFGPGKTGVHEIAAAAGVARGTLYNYFGSKEGIVRELISDKIDVFEKALKGTLGEMSDPLEKLKSAALERFRFLHRTPYIAAIILDEEGDATSRELVSSFEDRQRGIVARIMDEARRRGKIHRADIESVTDGVIYLLKGLEISLKTRLDTARLEDVEAEIARLITFFFSGAGKRQL
ncbi:MAG TPA: TetR/AcrR family transcriptional regulator [Spirochaetota bacterium]|nr:TetR/AcrR family transcriptional regulator [Spirochaetota bacterium]